MNLKNRAARLITINVAGEKGERPTIYRILPGDNPAVEVPDAVCKMPFVRALIEAGDLSVELADDEPAASVDQGESADIESLREQAEGLGINVDKRWSAKRLQAEIDKALGA